MTCLSIREIMHKFGEFRRDGINAIGLNKGTLKTCNVTPIHLLALK